MPERSAAATELATMRQALLDHIRDDDELKGEIRAHLSQQTALAGDVGVIKGKVETLAANNEQLMRAVFLGSEGQPSLTTTVSTIKDRTATWRWAVMALLAGVAAAASVYAAVNTNREGIPRNGYQQEERPSLQDDHRRSGQGLRGDVEDAAGTAELEPRSLLAHESQ